MKRYSSFFKRLGGSCLLGLILASSAKGQTLKVVDNPGGGQFVYGPIAPGASQPAVIGDMLSRIHQKFGSTPKVGRILRDKRGQSLAAFFDVNYVQGGGRPVSGAIILSTPTGGQAMGAVLYDESARFPTTANQMLRSLQAATSTRAAGGSSESRGEQRPSSRNVESDPAPKGEAWRPAGTPAPLTQTAFPDNSGSVGLPAGWRFLEAAGGYALLEGPKRERVVMSSGFSAWDMRNPQTANTFRNGQLPGRYVSIPFGTDPATAYTAVVTQMAIKLQRQPPTVQISSTEKAVGPDGFPYMVLKGEQDLHDGVGMRDLLVHYYVMAQPDAQGTWFLILFQYLVPKGLMQQELPTLAAMRRSYRENGQVIQSQNQAQLARAHQSFQNSQDLNRARNQAFDAHMADLDRQSADRGAANDGQDKRNQAFSNYLLDRTAIVDTRTGAQGTVSSGFATSLMQADPNFESVPTENLLKGITY